MSLIDAKSRTLGQTPARLHFAAPLPHQRRPTICQDLEGCAESCGVSMAWPPPCARLSRGLIGLPGGRADCPADSPSAAWRAAAWRRTWVRDHRGWPRTASPSHAGAVGLGLAHRILELLRRLQAPGQHIGARLRRAGHGQPDIDGLVLDRHGAQHLGIRRVAPFEPKRLRTAEQLDRAAIDDGDQDDEDADRKGAAGQAAHAAGSER